MTMKPYIYTKDWLEQPIPQIASLLDSIRCQPDQVWVLFTHKPELWYPTMKEIRDYAFWGKMDDLHGFVHRWLARYGESYPYPNVPANIWLGVYISNQSDANKRIPELLRIRAEKRVAYATQMEEQLLLSHVLGSCVIIDGTSNATGPGLDWVIAEGGEKPLHPDWVRRLRDDCKRCGVPLQFLSWGKYVVPEDGAQACRVCGCTWNNACNEGCYWVENDLCSQCVGKPVPEGGDRPVKYQQVPEGMTHRHIDGLVHDEYPLPGDKT